jgi:hypothetical protein
MYGEVDWGRGTHAACNGGGARLAHLAVEHDERGVTELIQCARKVSPTERLRMAIERPSGLLIDTPLEAACVIVPILPEVVKAVRPRHRAASGGLIGIEADAYRLADLLRTAGQRLRVLARKRDGTQALRALLPTRNL